VLVRDEHDGDAAVLIQALEERQTSRLVRVSRLPVGSSASSIGGRSQRTRDGHALLLAARELIRV